MALVLKDRVKETTTTTGTGTYTLAGAVTGFEAFSSVGDGNTTYYSCTDGTDFEVGIGTYTSSGTTLARTTILQSSNSDSAVSWSSGTKTIFCAQPAEKAVFVDENNDVILVSSDSGSGFDPILRFDRRSTSPADFDNLGAIEFVGRNDADETIFYGTISGMADDMTDGTEDGRVRIATVVNGSQVSHTDFTAGALEFRNEQVIRFHLQNGNFNTELLGGTPTENRSVTLPDATGTVLLTDGSGASLTSLNASQLSSGTVPNARLDQQLQDVAGLAVTNGNFIVGDGSNFVAESGATARTSLGLGTAAVLDTGISNTNVPKFTSGVADNDFLRVDGTAIEGRSASEVLSDIGATTAADAANEATALAIALG